MEADSRRERMQENMDTFIEVHTPQQKHTLTRAQIIKKYNHPARCLDLSGSRLDAVPSDASLIRCLRHLNLSANRFTIAPTPDLLPFCSTLTHLNLHNNLITSIDERINRFTSLRVLNLSGNELESIPEQLCESLGPTLRELNCFDNKICEVPACIRKLTVLEILRLSHNPIERIDPAIASLSRLVELNLSSARIGTVTPEVWSLPSLTELVLIDNRISSIPPEVSGLKSLKLLWLNANRLTRLPKEIAKLTALEDISLYNNRIAFLPTEMGRMKQLKRCVLLSNPIRDLPHGFQEMSLDWLMCPPECEVVTQSNEGGDTEKILFLKEVKPLLDLCCESVARQETLILFAPAESIDRSKEEEEGEPVVAMDIDRMRIGGAIERRDRKSARAADLPEELREVLATGARTCDGCGLPYYGDAVVTERFVGTIVYKNYWMARRYCSKTCWAASRKTDRATTGPDEPSANCDAPPEAQQGLSKRSKTSK